MWLRKAGRHGRPSKESLYAALAMTAALVVGGCSAAYVEQDASTVLFIVQSVADGAPLLSDVRGANNTLLPCRTKAKLSAQPKNPRSAVGSSENVRLTQYTVSYRRSDGRGVQGVDVPYTFTGEATALITAGGTTSVEVTIDLARHQAKLEPPLSNIVGSQLVTMYADVSFFGQTISGANVTASGTATVTFADFADGVSTCESAS